MKKILFLFPFLLALTSCQKKYFYINPGTNDTIASCLLNGKMGWYDVIVKDSISSDGEVVNILKGLNIYQSLLDETEKKGRKNDWFDFPHSVHFTMNDYGFLEFDSCRNYYLKASFHYDRFSPEHKISLFTETREEIEQEEERRNREHSERMKREIEDALSGRRRYYGDSMWPVTEYLQRNLGEYTPISSSDIIKKGEYYTVRHIYKTENMYGATIKCDKMFFINEYGEIADVRDFADYVINH